VSDRATILALRRNMAGWRVRFRVPRADRKVTGPSARRAAFGLLSAALLAWLPLTAGAQDPDNCLLCHQFRGLSRYDAATGGVRVYFVDPDYVHNLAGPHARLACTACHLREEVSVVPHQPVTRVRCTQTCHLSDPGNLERRFSHSNVATMLERSAHTRAVLSQLTFTGGPLLGPQQALCLYCHDEPVFRNPANVLPTLRALGSRTFDRCDVCHAAQIPVDVAYYLRHVAARLQPARAPLEQAQVCAVCHTDSEVLRTHELKNAVASFVRSFHGKAALLGDESTATCLSCHVAAGENAHLMLGRKDERSSVNSRRVATACRSTACHPGADPQFAAASVHLDLPTARATLEFAVAAAFILLTIGTFGPSLLLCLLELGQIVVGRRHEGRRESLALVQAVLAHPQGRRRLTRFTVAQRYQHWLLVLLFATLATTGFPMKFADQAWARSIIDTLGGLHVARLIHHWAGVALVLGFLAHLVYALPALFRLARQPAADGGRLGLLRAVWKLPMVIPPSDVRKAVQLLAYLLGLRHEPPTFGRFSVKEKFEYIGVFWGTTLLGITGVLLWGEQLFSAYITGRILNIALIAHTYEAFLAIIHVGILHIVNVIFTPHVFPLSLATITGVTPAAELADAHGEFLEEAARDLGVASGESPAHG
jgi:cytochrome b subunit of formate dehydrogenase